MWYIDGGIFNGKKEEEEEEGIENRSRELETTNVKLKFTFNSKSPSCRYIRDIEEFQATLGHVRRNIASYLRIQELIVAVIGEAFPWPTFVSNFIATIATLRPCQRSFPFYF